VPVSGGAPRVRRLVSLREEIVQRDALERELLSFDPSVDMASGIVLPPAIPLAARAAITTLLAKRFGAEGKADWQADAYEAWLYEPHRLLGGACPFERVIAGDALAVLVALIDPPVDPPVDRDATAASRPARATLTLRR
jgi:hypothetical protein